MFEKPVLVDCKFFIPGDPVLKLPLVNLGEANLPYPPLVGDIVRFAGKTNNIRYVVTHREFMVFGRNYGSYDCSLTCKLYEPTEVLPDLSSG